MQNPPVAAGPVKSKHNAIGTHMLPACKKVKASMPHTGGVDCQRSDCPLLPFLLLDAAEDVRLEVVNTLQ